MVMVIRLTTFAWNVHDGMKDEKDVIPLLRSSVVKEFPSLLEFYGFCTFFVTFIAGPALDMNDYRSFIRRTGAFASIPSRTMPTLRVLGLGGFCCAMYVVLSDMFSYEYCTTTEFVEMYSFWQRFLYIQAAGFATRIKYYGVFKVSEAACNLVGIGYTGANVWDRAQGVKVIGVELAENFKQLFDSWNIKTALWLRNCVYVRMVKPGEKPGTVVTFATFMVSALWHGFHPGYYMTFALGGIFPVIGRAARQYWRPLFLEPSVLAPYKWVYDATGTLFVWMCLNGSVAPFIVWYFADGVAAWRAVGWYPLIFCVGGHLLLNVSGGGKWMRRHVGKMVGAAELPRRKSVVVEKEKES
ncbi:lysophospholipid acyltransferase [Podochytrium sp. JEL0797]|nr:lysophospholipid acyltransferase [Podochytrium sp. JEL0797]